MPLQVQVTRYPWEALAPISREAVRNAKRVRRAISPLPSLAHLAEAVGQILSAEVRIALTDTPLPRPARPAAAAFLETEDGSTILVVELEPALVTLVLARVLGRKPELTSLTASLDDVTRGALSAVLVEVARRAVTTTTLRASADGILDGGARVDATVFVDARPYHACVHAFGKDGPGAAAENDLPLESLGDLELCLRIVGARSTAERRDLDLLGPGDVWLPGAGWLGDVARAADPATLPRLFVSRGALATPDAEWGAEVGRSEDGRLVLRGGMIALGADVAGTEARRAGGDASMSDETLTDLVLDAPVVVRVEVGSVTLSAREWASLSPGDVLETGIRLSEMAVLRVAGREVARGELVNVEGELGVRIRDIVPGEQSE